MNDKRTIEYMRASLLVIADEAATDGGGDKALNLIHRLALDALHGRAAEPLPPLNMDDPEYWRAIMHKHSEDYHRFYESVVSAAGGSCSAVDGLARLKADRAAVQRVRARVEEWERQSEEERFGCGREWLRACATSMTITLKVETCTYCGDRKEPGRKCPGNDSCIWGPAGGPAECCEKWDGMCCKCGASYARGQI